MENNKELLKAMQFINKLKEQEQQLKASGFVACKCCGGWTRKDKLDTNGVGTCCQDLVDLYMGVE